MVEEKVYREAFTDLEVVSELDIADGEGGSEVPSITVFEEAAEWLSSADPLCPTQVEFFGDPDIEDTIPIEMCQCPDGPVEARVLYEPGLCGEFEATVLDLPDIL